MEYTKAIHALPQFHPLLIPIYNNRAASRLKTGAYSDAISDCTFVLEMSPKDTKSLLRRATAWEGLEKWENAQADYRILMSIDAVHYYLIV